MLKHRALAITKISNKQGNSISIKKYFLCKHMLTAGLEGRRTMNILASGVKGAFSFMFKCAGMEASTYRDMQLHELMIISPKTRRLSRDSNRRGRLHSPTLVTGGTPALLSFFFTRK
jgi:hypothetical protein